MNNTSPALTSLPVAGVMPMSTGEVAALFRVNGSTVKRWAEAGLLEHFKTPGGHYRFQPAAVAALLDAAHTPAASSDVA